MILGAVLDLFEGELLENRTAEPTDQLPSEGRSSHDDDNHPISHQGA